MDLSDVRKLEQNRVYNASIYQKIKTALDILTTGVNDKTEEKKSYEKIVLNFINENGSNKFTKDETKYLQDYDAVSIPAESTQSSMNEKKLVYKRNRIEKRQKNRHMVWFGASKKISQRKSKRRCRLS